MSYEVLKHQKSDNLVVLVVWEPILPSDWTRPTRPVMARISDKRVIQFWDKDHLIAKRLSAQLRERTDLLSGFGYALGLSRTLP